MPQASCCFCRAPFTAWRVDPLHTPGPLIACWLCGVARRLKYDHVIHSVDADYLLKLLRAAGDEWLANFKRVEALKGVLPRPALELIAKELGVINWELSE